MSSDAGTVTRRASGVEEVTCQDVDKVKGGSHYDVQEDGRDLDPVKRDNANRGRDASSFKGESQATKNEAVGDEQLEQAVKNETVGLGLPLEGKSISARDLPQQLVVNGSQDLSLLLPKEVVLFLFKFMKPGDVLASSQTCQIWRKVGEIDKLWELKCKQAGLAYSLTAANLRALERRNKISDFAYSAWKENFLKPYRIAKKFREEVPQVITVEMNHNVGKMEFFNEKIVSARPYRNNLYVFCALSGKLLHELVGPTGYVTAIQMDSLLIISANDDGSVNVWNVDTGSCLHTLRGHTEIVSCLQMHGTIAVSGSKDRTLRMWDVQDGMCLGTLTGHTDRVCLVQFDGRRVVSDSIDFTIKVWDPETEVCLHTLNSHAKVYSLRFNGVDVVVGHRDGSIKIWEVNEGVQTNTLVGNQRGLAEIMGEMQLQGNMLVCQSDDLTTAKIWNMSTGACLHTLAGPRKHSDLITGIGVNDKLVVTSSWDGTVKLWDIRTGEFIKDLLVLEAGEWVLKIKMKDAKIVCFIPSNEKSKLLVLNFDTNDSD